MEYLTNNPEPLGTFRLLVSLFDSCSFNIHNTEITLVIFKKQFTTRGNLTCPLI
jgi:hypothetical protein